MELEAGSLFTDDHDFRRVPTFAPKAADQALFDTPRAAGTLDPAPLAQGLRLLKHVIRKPEHSREPKSWSRAYVHDGMVFGFRDGVLGVLQAPGLAGLEATVPVADIAAVVNMVRRMDGNCTGHFVTERHSLLTDEYSWLAMQTAADAPFRETTGMAYLLQREPSDEIVVPYRALLSEIDRCMAATKGVSGGHLVRLRVKDVGTWASLILRTTDQSKRHHGFAKLKCDRRCKLSGSVVAKDIDMHVNVKLMRALVSYFGDTFETTNTILDVLPPSAVLPRPVLRMRYEIEGKRGYVVQAFPVGTP
jgi:hypothetical protein